jgi:hypothetical protein
MRRAQEDSALLRGVVILVDAMRERSRGSARPKKAAEEVEEADPSRAERRVVMTKRQGSSSMAEAMPFQGFLWRQF